MSNYEETLLKMAFEAIRRIYNDYITFAKNTTRFRRVNCRRVNCCRANFRGVNCRQPITCAAWLSSSDQGWIFTFCARGF